MFVYLIFNCNIFSQSMLMGIRVNNICVGLTFESQVPGKPRVGLTFESQVPDKPRVGLTFDSRLRPRFRVSHMLDSHLRKWVHKD